MTPEIVLTCVDVPVLMYALVAPAAAKKGTSCQQIENQTNKPFPIVSPAIVLVEVDEPVLK